MDVGVGVALIVGLGFGLLSSCGADAPGGRSLDGVFGPFGAVSPQPEKAKAIEPATHITAEAEIPSFIMHRVTRGKTKLKSLSL